ncbi:MAG: glutamate racemase [Bdellovibrionota bacterium]
MPAEKPSERTDDDRPIGLFDSGIGGLTVLKALWSALPQESFVYLGDTARLPYGSKSPQTIERYCLQNIDFLLRRGVKAIVVACNTASTTLLDHGPREFPVPVYNVIEPGAAEALKASTRKQIGVLGTKATIAAKSYARAIHAIDKEATVYQAACPLLVPLVEEGLEEDPLTNLFIYRYLQPLLQAGVDTLILGCTHYPALRPGFEKVAGPNVVLVDSAQAIAHQIGNDMGTRLHPSRAPRRTEFLTTDAAQSFLEVAQRLMSPHPVPELIEVDIALPVP